jgi:hypothetical protein
LVHGSDLKDFFWEARSKPDSTGFKEVLNPYRPLPGSRDDFEEDWYMDEEIRIDDSHFSRFIDFEDKL